MSIDPGDIIPVSDLPRAPAGVGDDIVGVQLGRAKRFPRDSIPLSARDEKRLQDLIAGQQTSAIYADTLEILQQTQGSYTGQGAFVVNGENAGQYRWSGSSWEFLRADMLATKVDYSLYQEDLKETRRITSESEYISALTRWSDAGGFIAGEIRSDALETPTYMYGESGFSNLSSSMRPFSDNDFLIRDRFGFHLFSAKSAAQAVGEDSSRDEAVQMLNSDAVAASRAARDDLPTQWQRPVFDYNIVIVYGQSLAAGYEGWPAKSTQNQEPNLLMLGEATRPNNRASSTFVPVGSPTLQPMRAVVQATVSGNPVMTDAEVAALPAGSSNDGESIEVSAINFWRRLYLQDNWLVSDPSRKIVALNCAVGGQTIDRLSKGSSFNFYNRLVEAVTRVKTIADSEGKTCGIVSVIHCQGEFDYTGENGGVNDRAVFTARTEQLFSDIRADLATGICGQPLPPAVFTYQTGAQYSRDSAGLAIGMAQIDMASKPGVYLAAPNAPCTDKGGHLESNGYRWLGAQFGKVMHKVLGRGEGWQPLKPLRAIRLGQEILVGFVVPVAPLQFGEAYRVSSSYAPASRGFRVTDDQGEVEITEVNVAAACVISIKLRRAPVGAVKVWYAPQTTHSGTGNLRDSDRTICPFKYEFTAGSGDYPQFNIPELVGKPYPLNNYAVAFCIDAVE